MAKNKKLKLKQKQKQKQKQSQTVIVKVDNSRKTIRKGDTQPKQPKPSQPPIIINNQQPYMNPYNFIPPQPSLFQSQATPQATKTTTTTTNNNVDDAINAFSKTNEDRFKTLQEQLNTMNDNFRQASRNIMERIDPQSYNKDDSVQQQSTTTTQPSISIRSIPVPPVPPTPTTKKPSKVIIIDDNENKQQLNPQYNMTGLTPSRTAIELRKTPSRTESDLTKQLEESPYTKRFSRTPVTVNNTQNEINKLPSTLPDINLPKETQLNFLDKDMEELDQMLNSISPYQTPKLTQQNNKQYSTPKLLPYNPSESSYGPSSQLDSYLRQVDKQTEKQIKADEKLSKFKQEELDALEAQTVPDTEPLEIKKPDQDDKPVRDTKKDLMKGKFNNYAEEGICPVCSAQYESKDAVHKHLIKHHKANPDDKDVFVENGKTYKTHRQRDTIITKDGKKSYKFNDIDYEQIDEQEINKMIEDRNREPLEGRNEKNRVRMTQNKKKPANEI